MDSAVKQEVRLPLVEAMPLPDLLRRWEDHYSLLIESALEHSLRAEDNVHAVMDKLIKGEATAIRISQGDDELGIAICDGLVCKDGHYLNIWTLTGRDIDFWLVDLQDYLEHWGKLLGFVGLVCGGRAGWERKLSTMGWDQKAVIMRREFES